MDSRFLTLHKLGPGLIGVPKIHAARDQQGQQVEFPPYASHLNRLSCFAIGLQDHPKLENRRRGADKSYGAPYHMHDESPLGSKAGGDVSKSHRPSCPRDVAAIGGFHSSKPINK